MWIEGTVVKVIKISDWYAIILDLGGVQITGYSNCRVELGDKYRLSLYKVF